MRFQWSRQRPPKKVIDKALRYIRNKTVSDVMLRSALMPSRVEKLALWDNVSFGKMPFILLLSFMKDKSKLLGFKIV